MITADQAWEAYQKHYNRTLDECVDDVIKDAMKTKVCVSFQHHDMGSEEASKLKKKLKGFGFAVKKIENNELYSEYPYSLEISWNKQ